jgi:hypothetical protein
MDSIQTSKLRMAKTTLGTLQNFKTAWQALPAFAEGVEELEESLTQIEALVQAQTSRTSSASAEKAQAFQALVDAAYEVAGAVHACAVASSNKELADRVDFSRSAVGDGSDSKVVARCQHILQAGMQHVESLGDYGVTSARLNILKKRIEAFQAVQTKPRQTTATVRAATKQLQTFFAQIDTLLKRRLDRLVIQFRESEPAFFNAYATARRTVASGARSSKEPKVLPAPVAVPQPKAA